MGGRRVPHFSEETSDRSECLFKLAFLNAGWHESDRQTDTWRGVGAPPAGLYSSLSQTNSRPVHLQTSTRPVSFALCFPIPLNNRLRELDNQIWKKNAASNIHHSFVTILISMTMNLVKRKLHIHVIYSLLERTQVIIGHVRWAKTAGRPYFWVH